eukprot:6254062-Alexandrium_andersonii.AAC.1
MSASLVGSEMCIRDRHARRGGVSELALTIARPSARTRQGFDRGRCPSRRDPVAVGPLAVPGGG